MAKIKLKTNKAAAKRFKISKTGKILRPKAGARHLLTHKSAKRKKRLRKEAVVEKCLEHRISHLLPYGLK